MPDDLYNGNITIMKNNKIIKKKGNKMPNDYDGNIMIYKKEENIKKKEEKNTK